MKIKSIKPTKTIKVITLIKAALLITALAGAFVGGVIAKSEYDQFISRAVSERVELKTTSNQ